MLVDKVTRLPVLEVMTQRNYQALMKPHLRGWVLSGRLSSAALSIQLGATFGRYCEIGLLILLMHSNSKLGFGLLSIVHSFITSMLLIFYCRRKNKRTKQRDGVWVSEWSSRRVKLQTSSTTSSMNQFNFQRQMWLKSSSVFLILSTVSKCKTAATVGFHCWFLNLKSRETEKKWQTENKYIRHRKKPSVTWKSW